MQTGDLVFFKGTSFISRVIGWLTKSPYTHVAIVVEKDQILEADRFILSRITHIDNEKVFSVLRYPLKPQQMENIKLECYKSVGIKYDYFQIFIWFFRLLSNHEKQGMINNANRTYCSELVDRIYAKQGIDLVPNRINGDVLPVHLLESPILVKIK
jgi:uncharacterized protein YycO